MSHTCGRVVVLSPTFQVGPATGEAPTSANTWQKAFVYTPAPGDTKFVILHFINVALPGTNRLEVELGYDTDVFTAASGTSFWTRPINVGAVGASITIRYKTAGGSNTGGATLDRYGRGESMQSVEPPHDSISNCNPFLINGWVEPNFPHISGSTAPKYDPFWICDKTAPPKWQNARCAAINSVQQIISKSVGMIVTCHQADANHNYDHVSTCSVTLIDSDLVVLAAHCISNFGFEVPTSSVTFDYEVQCDGSLVPNYNAVFYKVIKLVKFRFTDGRDYAVLQIRGTPPVPPVPVRISDVMPGENVFGVHQPNGAVKKISPSASTFKPVKPVDPFQPTMISVDFDVAGGSSGSGLFDTAGNILGVLSNGVACDLKYSSMKLMMSDPIVIPNPPTERAVMMVLDRSGSMGGSAGGGKIKINEARAAASMFVGMVRTTGNKLGLVSFSNDASNPVDHPLNNANNGQKNQINNKLGTITPGGATSIGDGLIAARDQLAGAASLPPAILLLTDGMENTPAMISSVTGLDPIMITAIGFGEASSLDGARLSNLAQSHGGLYKRAGSGLELKKFFALAFGEIFEAGALADPMLHIGDKQYAGQDVPFHVCGEEAVTIAIGWDNDSAQLLIEVETPSGQIVNLSGGGIELGHSTSWAFARIPLPQHGERDGVWKARVVRPKGGGEFPPPPIPLDYFINVIARGGPMLRPMAQPVRLYTGDLLHPRVMLHYPDESTPAGGEVSLTLRRPAKSAGSLIAKAGLAAPRTISGDVIPARQATLQAIEQATGTSATGQIESHYTLDNDYGAFASSGIFGALLDNVLVVEGDYNFHAKAMYGSGCIATRECQWGWHVSVGIDGNATPVTTNPLGPDGSGRDRTEVVFVPQDRFGNLVGPGMAGEFAVHPLPGQTVEGGLVDRGDGSYTQVVTTDPDSGDVPGIAVAQPGRPPEVVAPQSVVRKVYAYTAPLACGTVPDDCCACTPLAPGRYATALTLHNETRVPVKVALNVAATTLFGAQPGRWPAEVPFKAEDRIVLAPGSTTTIDCCAIAKLLLGADAPAAGPATSGLLALHATGRLAVWATYTTSGEGGGAPGIEVERIDPSELLERQEVTRPNAPALPPDQSPRLPPPRPQDWPATPKSKDSQSGKKRKKD